MLRDGPTIARLWMDKANVSVKDLPLIARIIRYTKDKTAISASQIIPHKMRLIIEKAKQYEDMLEKYDVRIVTKRGGISFEAC